jgi:hypothetical protein
MVQNMKYNSIMVKIRFESKIFMNIYSTTKLIILNLDLKFDR